MTTEEFQREVLDRLTRIENLLGCSQPGPKDSDLAMLRTLLPAIAGTRGSEVFRASEVLADPILRKLVSNISAQRLGAMLSRCTDTDIAGYCVERLKTQNGILSWRVGKVDTGPPKRIAVLKSRLR